VANIRILKNKSNSQRLLRRICGERGCGKYQNFKEQKQFTTIIYSVSIYFMLWQISEFQRTKAIHNGYYGEYAAKEVVANIGNSKNKSKSQRNMGRIIMGLCCGKYQKFKEQKRRNVAKQKSERFHFLMTELQTSACSYSYFFLLTLWQISKIIH
jgi:hypothetical protein